MVTGHNQPTWLWQFENTAHNISSFLPLYLSKKRYIALFIGLKPLKTSLLLNRDIHVFWYFVFWYFVFLSHLSFTWGSSSNMRTSRWRNSPRSRAINISPSLTYMIFIVFVTCYCYHWRGAINILSPRGPQERQQTARRPPSQPGSCPCLCPCGRSLCYPCGRPLCCPCSRIKFVLCTRRPRLWGSHLHFQLPVTEKKDTWKSAWCH